MSTVDFCLILAVFALFWGYDMFFCIIHWITRYVFRKEVVRGRNEVTKRWHRGGKRCFLTIHDMLFWSDFGCFCAVLGVFVLFLGVCHVFLYYTLDH